jgi:hypothetical protein
MSAIVSISITSVMSHSLRRRYEISEGKFCFVAVIIPFPIYKISDQSLFSLLSAYELSRDEAFLKKADDLGTRLAKASDTPSGMPRGSVDLRSGKSNK